MKEYKKIIETNFFNIKSYFELYSLMPIKCFMRIERVKEDYDVNIYICKEKKLEKNNVVKINIDDVIVNNENSIIYYLGEEYDIIWQINSGAFEYMGGYKKNYIDMSNISRQNIPIRNLVYDQIYSEIDNVLNNLFRDYGLDRSE